MAWSPKLSNNVNKPESVGLFEVATGALKQTFVTYKHESWPFFKYAHTCILYPIPYSRNCVARWSADGQFFGRLEKGAYVYYSSADGRKQKPLTAANGNIVEAAWSPADNTIALCTAPFEENSSQPTRIVLLVRVVFFC